MLQQPSANRLILLLALPALFLLFFHRLADRDLWSSHEARAAMDAQSILDGDDWALPHLYDGRAELQKPPLYYWLVAGIAWLRGGDVDAWAVRLPAALAALGCVGVLTLLGWERGRPIAVLLAGTILATAVHFTWLARIGRIDMPLTLAVAIAVTAFHLASYRRRPVYLFLGYLAIASAILLKGPIGLVLPAVVVGLHSVMEAWLDGSLFASPLAAMRGKGLWWGVPLVAALTLPWFLWANHHTGGDFFRVFFWEHNVERGLGGGRLRGHPWWYYAPFFASDFLPWTPLLVLAFVLAWKYAILRTDPEARLGLVWFVAVFGILSCASYKRQDYLLPAYPGAALFLACVARHLEQRWQAWAGTHRWFPYGILHAALCAVMVGVWLVRVERYLPAKEPFRDYRAFAAEVRQHAPPPNAVIFFRTEAHALAFHIGRPLEVFVRWEELSDRLDQPGTHFVVMPPDCAEKWSDHLHAIRLEELSRNTTLAGGDHERPLVLFRAESIETLAQTTATNFCARTSAATADCR
jgi:4-amino-4-deoxy-L-arabinose transferase-like glycosyltransferase